jgi:isocitrate dehydrogenase
MQFDKIHIPQDGEAITVKADRSLSVPARPIIPFIEGDGVGPEIRAATVGIVERAVEKAYGGTKKIEWVEVYAGGKARGVYGELLPEETLRAIEQFVVAVKGPLTTPVGEGTRSLNVAMRQKLGLFACVRWFRHYPGVPSPVKYPETVDWVLFRENTEDVYAGIEWQAGSESCRRMIDFVRQETGIEIGEDAGIGLKPMSERATKRLVRSAVEYALQHNRERVTIVHKGNIMKYTEGAFVTWGYEVATGEFRDRVVLEEEMQEGGGEDVSGRVLVKDRIADAMFQELLLSPERHDVLAMPNLNGDYFSDACAAVVGGLGVAPGANLGDRCAVFEAIHGTAPDIAGLDKVNPTSLLLSCVMMLVHLGWREAGELIEKALVSTWGEGNVTEDLARQMKGQASFLSCSTFSRCVLEKIN